MNRNVQKNKVSFNVIDVFILVFVAACLVGLVIRVGNFNIMDNGKSLEDYRIHFDVSNISSDSEDYFIRGDSVTDTNSGLVLGKIEMIDSISPAQILVKNAENEYVTVNYPPNTRVDISGTLISSGVMESNGYMLGGTTHIAAGDVFVVQSEHMNFTLTVTNIAKK